MGLMKEERDTTPRADRLTIARALREMAGLLDASGQETFRARAYARGAEVLEAIRKLRAPEAQRVLLPEALATAEAMHNHLVKAPGTGKVEAAGDLRRWDESLDLLSLIVAADQPADTMKHALRAPLLAEV